MKRLVVSMLLILSMANSAPSTLGTNGLINMPVAMSIKYKEFDVGINWKTIQNINNQNRFQMNYFANMGIFDGIEFGFIGTNIQEGVFLNLKYFMMSDKSTYPLALAAGINNISSRARSDLYLVLSKSFPNNLNGHFGFGSNIMATTIKANVMFGIDILMNKYMTILADLMGSESSWNLSAGLRIKLAEDMLLNAYIEDIGNSTPDKATFTLGFSWHGLFQ